MRRSTHVLLALALLAGPALGQDDAAKDAADDSPFLKVSKAKVDDPPLGVSRPSDSWQFVDLEKVKTQLAARGQSTANYLRLKFQLWYGAARATIIVRAWKLNQKPNGKRPVDELLADSRIKELQGILRDSKLGKRKRTKVGKRAGIWFEIAGKAARPNKPTELRDLTIYNVVCYRPEDMAVVMLSIEFSDPKRAKSLAKDFKKLVKKVKF